MSDQIEVLRGMRDELLAAYSHEMAIDNPKCAADYKARADALTFALSAREGGGQHAEAGAVAWRWVDERGRAMTRWVTGDPPPMDSVSDEKGTMRVEIRSAQAASQEGEALDELDRKRFEQAPCYLCGYNGAGYYQPATHPCANRYHASQQANPTGDRVRRLVEKWRAKMEGAYMTGDPVIDARTESYDAAYTECADELAAALDQEKGK